MSHRAVRGPSGGLQLVSAACCGCEIPGPRGASAPVVRPGPAPTDSLVIRAGLCTSPGWLVFSTTRGKRGSAAHVAINQEKKMSSQLFTNPMDLIAAVVLACIAIGQAISVANSYSLPKRDLLLDRILFAPRG